MKIFFTFPYVELEKYYEHYQTLIDVLKAAGHELTYEWVDEAMELIKVGKPQPSRAKRYARITKAIRDADVCIFDVTIRAMSAGQQFTYAIEHSKPTLLLNNVAESRTLEELYVGGSKSGFLTLNDYRTTDEAIKYLNRFLERNGNSASSRFNLNIEKYLMDYIESRAFEENLTKTDIMKTAIRNMMEQDGQ